MQITVSEGQIQHYQAEAGVKLRIYCRRTFTTSDLAVVQRGTVDADDFYLEVNCTVAGTIITHEAFTIDSTTDGSPDSSYYTFAIYDTNGDRIAIIHEKIRIPSTPTPTTMAAILTYNDAECECLPNTYYTAEQVDTLLDALQDTALKETTVIYGVGRLSHAAVDVADPINVGDNDPVIRVLRQRVYLEEYDDDLTAALADIGVSDAVLVVSKADQYTHTAATVTAGPLTVGDWYEIVTYPGAVVAGALEIGTGGTGYSVGNNNATSGGSGSGLTLNITGVENGGAGIVAGVTVNSAGSDYEVGDQVTITGGDGNAVILIRQVNADDFENVGAAFYGYPTDTGNAKGTIFQATGTTPTTWTNGTVLRTFLEIPSNITVEFEGLGSLRAEGAGGGIFINSMIDPGDRTVFTSDGSGKILIDQRSVVESNLKWWGAPTGTDDSHTIRQALDCCAIEKRGGRLLVPGGDWYTDQVEIPQHTTIKGVGGDLDSDQRGTSFYPADEAATHVGVFSLQPYAQGVMIKDLVLTQNQSETVNAFRAVHYVSSSQNVHFENVRFESWGGGAIDGAVYQSMFSSTDGFHEFVNYNFIGCSWTCQDNTSALFWRSTNSVGLFLSAQFRIYHGSNGFHGRNVGFVTLIQPEFRGVADYTLTPTLSRTITGAASITNGTKVLNLTPSDVDGEFFTKADIGRIVSIPLIQFEGRDFTYITGLNNSYQATVFESADSTATTDDLQIDDLGTYPNGANACFYLDSIHHTLNVFGSSDEGVNYLVRDLAADYPNTMNIWGGQVACQLLFEGSSSCFNAFGTHHYSCSYNSDNHDVLARIFGGTFHNEVVPRYVDEYPFPDWPTLVAANPWHLRSNEMEFVFDSSYKKGDRQSYQHNIINEITTFIHRNAFGGPTDDEPQVSIFSPLLGGGPTKALLRLGRNYAGLDVGRYYYDLARDSVTGALTFTCNQPGYEALHIIDGDLVADLDVLAGNDVLADGDMIAQQSIRTPSKASVDHGIGYSTGAGDEQTQATSRTTGVTSNAMCGLITTSSASVLADNDIVTFTVTNNCVGQYDAIHVSGERAGDGAPNCIFWVSDQNIGSFKVSYKNISGSPEGNAYYVRYWIGKGVNA